MSLLLAMALQAATEAPCAPGIYVAEGDALRPLAETQADHRKVAGLAGAMLLGPFGGNKMKVKSVVPGPHAAVQVTAARPVFQFCFPAPEPAQGGSDYVGVGGAASSPSEYYLVRFDAGAEQRELALSTVGGFGGPKGALSQSVTPFKAELVAPGRYRVTPDRDLAPGEYGFMQPPAKTASARKKDTVERVFDFGIAG